MVGGVGWGVANRSPGEGVAPGVKPFRRGEAL